MNGGNRSGVRVVLIDPIAESKKIARTKRAVTLFVFMSVNSWFLTGCGPQERKLPALPPLPVAAEKAGAGGGPPAVSALSDVAQLFPWHSGDVWELEVESGGQPFKFTLTATAELDVGGKKARFIEMKKDGQVLQSEGYVVDDQGIHRIAFGPAGTGRIEPPMTILKTPVQNGATWEWKGVMQTPEGPVKAQATFKLTGPEKVRVPAGEFQAWQVEQELTEAGADSKSKTTNILHYAPGLGLIRQETVTPDGLTTGDLIRYKPADSNAVNVGAGSSK